MHKCFGGPRGLHGHHLRPRCPAEVWQAAGHLRQTDKVPPILQEPRVNRGDAQKVAKSHGPGTLPGNRAVVAGGPLDREGVVPSGTEGWGGVGSRGGCPGCGSH